MANAAKQLVCGIDESVLDEGAVDEGLADPLVDIVPAPGMKLLGKVGLLVKHFRTLKEADLAVCDKCKAQSHADLARCPFCGDAGEVAPAVVPPPSPEPGEEVGDPPDAADDGGNPGDEEEPAPPAPAPVVAEHPTTGQPLVDKKAAKAARDAEKAAGKAAAKEEAKKAPVQDATGSAVTAIVESKVDPAVLASVEQLDRDVAECRRLARGMAAGSWLFAHKVAEISESQRWKLRLDDKGKVRYRTFEDFAKAELEIGREYARDLQKIAVRFTKDVFEAVGPSKLRFVLRAPEEEQAEVLNAIKEKGLGTRATQEEVEKRRAKKGFKTSRGEKAKSRKPAEKGKITVANILSKHTIRAFKKPDRRLAEGEAPVRAKRLADRPYASLPLGNDVTLWVECTTDGAGEVIFKFDIRRNED